MVKKIKGIILLFFVVIFFIYQSYSFYYSHLIKKYLLYSKRVWELENILIKSYSFELVGRPRDIGSGTCFKLFLVDNKNQKWIYKLPPETLNVYFSRQISYFFRFLGFSSPLLTIKRLPVNNNYYLGTIQKMVPKKYDIHIPRDLSNLKTAYIQDLLSQEIVAYLFNNFHLGHILGEDGLMYIVDLNDLDIPYEVTKNSNVNIESLFPIFANFNDYQRLEIVTRFKELTDEDKIMRQEIENILNTAKGCCDFYKYYEYHFKKTFYHLHIFAIKNGIPPDIKNISKTINLITTLSNKDFLSLVKVPEIDSKMQDYYLGFLLKRRQNLKKYFKLLYNQLNKESKIKIKLNFYNKYTIGELMEKIQVLKDTITRLALEIETESKNKNCQEVLHPVNSPEPLWITALYFGGLIPYEFAVSGIEKIIGESNNEAERNVAKSYLKQIEDKKKTPKSLVEMW